MEKNIPSTTSVWANNKPLIGRSMTIQNFPSRYVDNQNCHPLKRMSLKGIARD